MKQTKLRMLAAILLLCGTTVLRAQTNLAGRTYHNANIIADAIKDEVKDAEKKIAEAKTKAIAKAKEKKGRDLTKEELAELDKKVAESMQMVEAIKKGTSTAITVEFKDGNKAVMKADMKISDEALKTAGIGWAKRKLMKAALAVAPSTTKVTYTVNGNLIILKEDKEEESDTLRLSADGKYLYGKFDKKTPFKLTRTK